MSLKCLQAHVSVAGANVQTQKEMDWCMANFVNVMTENALMMKQERFVQVCILMSARKMMKINTGCYLSAWFYKISLLNYDLKVTLFAGL